MPIHPSARSWGRAALVGLLDLSATGALAASDRILVVSSQDANTRAVEVRVADLDLDSAYARKTLANRIERAARKVCDINQNSYLDTLPSAQACVDRAQSGALAQLEARGLPAPGRVSADGGMR